MELLDDFGQFKSEFARQIAMEEEKAKNMNMWLLKGQQHGLRRGRSESLLGRKHPLGHNSAPLSRSKLCGSVGSLPSLLKPKQEEEEEEWVSSDEFKDILDLKEKKLIEEEVGMR